MPLSVKNGIVNVITLGCSKNLVDSEMLMRQLKAQGFTIIYDDYQSDVQTVIINTCGFINDAKQESVDTILQFVKAKEEGRIQDLYVMGCLSQRYLHDLKKEIPEVNMYFGVNDIQRILEQLGGRLRKELLGERILTTPGHYAYLKVSEGCDRRCSFCAIPMIRGKQTSRTLEDINKEAEYLVSSGVRELILIAQDLTAYGTDLYGKQMLGRLLQNLTSIKNLNWVRLHYTYPTNFPDEILHMIREHDSVCNYLDIPFQHISDKVLQKMHRGINARETMALIDKIRNTIPGIAIRTTLMVGHPGESEKEFNKLHDFVRDQQFERLGVFTYSEEEGTYGAKYFTDEIPYHIKLQRLEEIMKLQSDISLQMNNKKVEKILNVLIDRKEGVYFTGRTEHDSPEIDNEVLIKIPDEPAIRAGEFYSIKVTGAEEFDIYGEVVN